VLVGFLLLTLNPAASHALARAAYKTGTPQWRHAVSRGPGEAAPRRAES
jgi:multicomponent Na+:H+ antiporter subunit G